MQQASLPLSSLGEERRERVVARYILRDEDEGGGREDVSWDGR